jgi:hypothetical protein
VSFPVLGICAGGAGLWDGFWALYGGWGGCRRKLMSTSAYAALIAAISGPMPRMFMTRLRL